ncbi:uncharacterized protein LTR77_005037 [Saxophila tyrrhenica]|uniref:Cell wall proline rich protein n=1 Tax=Saxophila tyrrhenica TaxID=1690608 RepID=A0AAV9PD96_9PEZI|nr:hypothetical protein LTR77_005037 [Saxophila tyrrhenica]
MAQVAQNPFSGGLTATPPQTPGEGEENAPVTPSRRGHRRGGSEFVGGDSRFGVSNALSSSPTKSNALPIPLPSSGPPPGARRGHAHRRSAAMSSHDVSNIMQPSEPGPRLSSSLPATPMELPGQTPLLDRTVSAPSVSEAASDPFGPPLDDAPTRPPSRPRVGFDDNVVIIPRPLSTISSGTEGSISTLRNGHSVNNSISSVISMGTPSPPASRISRNSVSLNSTIEEAPSARARSSLEISRRLEKEGEWLKSRSSSSLKRPHSETVVPTQTTTFVEPELPARSRPHHTKKHSIGHALGFDRRRSEPAIGVNPSLSSRLSATSLQESDTVPSRADQEADFCEHRSSARKIKQWAASKISRRSKEPSRALVTSGSGTSLRPVSEGSMFVAGKVPVHETPVAETDLDAVFHSQGAASQEQRPGSQARTDLSTPTPSQHSSFQSRDNDEPGTMLDLDAALGPFKTPPIGSQRQRKELHSNRLAKDFTGPGGHYHRRAESAPALPPMDPVRLGTPSQSSMADVFEEEEEEHAEEAQAHRPASIATSARSGAEDESNVGVEIVDLDSSDHEAYAGQGSQTGLGIQRSEWQPERPSTSHSNIGSRLSTAGMEHRGSSIIDETIMEESSPVEAVEIVEAHEEPRNSSLTKSSDSSDTPTLLGASAGMLTLSDGTQSTMTPETFQTSTFSSPDFAQRQTSFEAPRLGTSASSIADNRTMSSTATGEHGPELRASVDDVPSLTSSRSTMLSTAHANTSRRDFSNSNDASRIPPAVPRDVDPAVAAERRRKRSSIQSLSQLMGGHFGGKAAAGDDARPVTAVEPATATGRGAKKEYKRHRLEKLMFWKSKTHSRPSAP